MTKRIKTNNNLQNTTQKTKDRATGTSLKLGHEIGCSERLEALAHVAHIVLLLLHTKLNHVMS